MSFAPKKPCAVLGCPNLVASGVCDACRESGRGREDRRGARERGYTPEWERYRARFLLDHPYCVNPFGRHNRFVLATVVDHKRPHRGDPDLFWNSENHQGLCKGCHDRKTALLDGGFGRDISIGKPQGEGESNL